MRRQAQDRRARETSNRSFMKWASLAVDLKAFGHVGEVGETCVPDVRRQIQAFPQGELQRERRGAAGVTDEHLPGPETGRFPVGRSRSFPDPAHRSGWESGRAVRPINAGVFLHGRCDWGCDTPCDTGPKASHSLSRHSSPNRLLPLPAFLLPPQTIPAVLRPSFPRALWITFRALHLDVRFRSSWSLFARWPEIVVSCLGTSHSRSSWGRVALSG